jgi:hypothetical protein
MLLSSFLLFSCMATPQGTSFEKVLYEVKYDLLNPDSIRVREAEWVNYDFNGFNAYAFRFAVNAENILGGMTGYQNHFAIIYPDSEYLTYENELVSTSIVSFVNNRFDNEAKTGRFSEAQINAILSRI